MRRQAAPSDKAGQTEPVEIRRRRSCVMRRARSCRSQALAGASKPCSWLRTSSVPRSPGTCVPGATMLPGEQPAHELGCRDGRDLSPQRTERQPVNAREQAPVAPLFCRQLRGFAFCPCPRPEIVLEVRRPSPRSAASPLRRRRGRAPAIRQARAVVVGPICRKPALHERDHRVGTRRRRCGFDRGQHVEDARPGKTRAAVFARSATTQQTRPPVSMRPARRSLESASSNGRHVSMARAENGFGQHDERLQCIVKIVGVTHVRPRVFANCGDRGRVEPADL